MGITGPAPCRSAVAEPHSTPYVTALVRGSPAGMCDPRRSPVLRAVGLGQCRYAMWLVRTLEVPDIFGRELDGQCSQDVVELLEPCDPDDRSAHDRSAEQPGDRHLCTGGGPPASHGRDGFHDHRCPRIANITTAVSDERAAEHAGGIFFATNAGSPECQLHGMRAKWLARPVTAGNPSKA
jgi:hypothetical protein